MPSFASLCCSFPFATQWRNRFPRTPLILKLHQHEHFLTYSSACTHASRMRKVQHHYHPALYFQVLRASKPTAASCTRDKEHLIRAASAQWLLGSAGVYAAQLLVWDGKQMSRGASGLRPLPPGETQVLAEPGAQLSLRCLSLGLLCQQEALLTRTWLWPVTGRLRANMLPWKLGNAKLWLDNCVLGCSSPLVSLTQGLRGCYCGWDVTTLHRTFGTCL